VIFIGIGRCLTIRHLACNIQKNLFKTLFFKINLSIYAFKERLQACLVQYLSDESDKDDKDGESNKKTEIPDVILVEDSGDEAQPRKKRHRSISGSREHRKALKTDRRVVVDMGRVEKRSTHDSDRRRDSDRKRDEKIRSRDELKRDDKQSRKIFEKSKDESRKEDMIRKKLEDDRRKEANKKDELRRREHEKR
jgi:serine/threonine-protein kinase PRP4